MLRSNIDYIVVGLGNIGSEYEMTRHNMGFMVLDKIADELGLSFKKEKFRSLIVKERIFGKQVLFMKPKTYMNNSGLAVAEAANFYKVPTQNILVIYDDITLDIGNVKIKKQGSAGGHNGIKSIIEMTGQDNFLRIKVGISAKPTKDYKLSDWVLSKFRQDELESLRLGVDLASKATQAVIKNGEDFAMNNFNRSLR